MSLKRKSRSSDDEERPNKKQKLSSSTSSYSEESTVEEYSSEDKKLDCVGRICWMDYENHTTPCLKYNKNKKIDGITLEFDKEMQEIKIRHYHSECLEFWMETRIGLQDLKLLLIENGFFLGIKK